MSARIDHALGLYLEGIRDGNIHEALDRHTGSCYVQHSAGVADGKEGFAAFFGPFVERNPVRDIRVVRAFEDGQYVFCHVYQSLNHGEAKWVTADLFDTDEEGRVVEHWDVIQAYAEVTASGRSMVDGPADVVDLHLTEENKAIVGAFAEDVLLGGRVDRLERYVFAERYHQHSPSMNDGLAAFREFLHRPQTGGASTVVVEVHRLIGQGNFVVLLCHARVGGVDHAIVDLFRLEEGKIVEHWDVQEAIAPRNEWNNSGKF
jgi:predicted SnoaL-like aldol condensation-catalyzing enzyme